MFDIPLHPFVVHFPVTLAIFAFMYDGWAVYSKRPQKHELGYGLSLWAGVFAAVAVVTGLQLSRLGDIGKGAITGHALYGIASAIILAAFALWRYSSRARQETALENYSMLSLLIQAVGAVLILMTALTGHHLTPG